MPAKKLNEHIRLAAQWCSNVGIAAAVATAFGPNAIQMYQHQLLGIPAPVIFLISSQIAAQVILYFTQPE